jgi:hypothetical protein
VKEKIMKGFVIAEISPCERNIREKGFVIAENFIMKKEEVRVKGFLIARIRS